MSAIVLSCLKRAMRKFVALLVLWLYASLAFADTLHADGDLTGSAKPSTRESQLTSARLHSPGNQLNDASDIDMTGVLYTLNGRSTVPEPSSIGLVASAVVAGAALWLRRRKSLR
jgi:hypothetical protein